MVETDPGRPTTKNLDLARPGDGDAWEVPHWVHLVLPNEDGELHHGSRGARMPDTIVVRLDGEPVALADIFSHVLDNQYCYDCEYYLALRLRALLDPAAWRTLPWGQVEPGDVFLAYDKFHGHEYLRTADDDRAMSYGGDWNDLQSVIDAEHPRPEGPRPLGRVSPATLLRAVRCRDAALVRALLAAGADPEAGGDPPDEALRAVSTDRDTTALWEAIFADDAAIVEALLAAGASVRARSAERWSPLWGALVNRRAAVVPVLLRFGADPDVVWKGKSARQLAQEVGLAHLLPPRG